MSYNPEDIITEDLVDFIKLGASTAPAGAYFFLGISLDNWMFIMSIVASLFYILDKLPMAIRRGHAFYTSKIGRSGDSSPPNQSS